MRHSILHCVVCPLVLHDRPSIARPISTSKENKNTRRVTSCGTLKYMRKLFLKHSNVCLLITCFIKRRFMKVSGEEKINFALEGAMEAQRGSSDIALLLI